MTDAIRDAQDGILAQAKRIEAARASRDAFGRTPIADAVKAQIAAAFTTIPDGKTGALLVLVDERGARAHLAARLGGQWKVAAGAGRTWDGDVSGSVAIAGAW